MGNYNNKQNYNNRQNNNHQRDNYFKQQIKRFGVNFLERNKNSISPRDVKRALMDVCRGNIDIETEGRYFLVPYFRDACMNFAYSKMYYYSTLAKAMTFYNESNLDGFGSLPESIISIQVTVQNQALAWTHLYNMMRALYNSNPDYVGIITCTINQLEHFKYVIQ